MITIMIDDPFALLPPGRLKAFQVETGTHVFRNGEAGTAMLRVDAGRLALVRVTEDGHRVTIAQAGPGETLAEASIFADAYHCDCVALSPARGVQVEGTVIRDYLRHDADFAEAFVARLALQVREERLRTQIMSIRSARERTFAALTCFGQPDTVTALAASIGLTQEACSRALADLLSEGRITRIARGRYAVS